MARAAWVGLLATALNLLPIGQLDGGHILYAFLGERTKISLPHFRCRAGVRWAFFFTYSWLVWAVLLFFFGMRHPAIVDPRPHRPRAHLARLLALLIVLALSFTGRPGSHHRSVKISATIITLNEERNIARAIESLRCADEIVVLDSGSTDRTVEIAEKLGARVIESSVARLRQAEEPRRRAGLPRLDSFIDADESLSEALEAEIWQLKKSGPQFDAYTMPRLAQYLGRWIRHSGWYPDRKVRLYHRAQSHWEGAYVHESVKVRPPRTLESNLLHFTCNSLSEHFGPWTATPPLAAEHFWPRGK